MSQRIVIIGIGLLLSVFLATAAFGGCENDLMFARGLEDPAQAFIAEPLDFSKPFKMNKVMGIYVIDRGVNFYRDENNNYELSQCRMQQVSCSPGLTGGAYFGQGNPGYIDLTSANPHKHLNWGVSAPGTYFFEFKLTNAKDINGNPLRDSPVFLMVFIAERDYAAVDVKTAHRMPNGSKVEIGDLKSSTSGDFNGFIYAQTTGRYAGIRVVPNTTIPPGTTFSAKGILGQVGGERTFTINEITSSSAGSAPEPVLMLTKCLGGPGEVINTPSSADAVGLRTTGTLVKVCGTLRQNSYGDVFIDDGCGVQYDPEVKGCRIALEGLVTPFTLPTAGFASVTGISGVDDNLLPVIRPRSSSDVQTY